MSDRFLVPRSEWLAEPSDLGLKFENIEVPTGSSTTVHGWFLPADSSDGRTVLLCHGNGANISFYHPYYSFLHAAGWNVLLHDYRGYGRSQGDCDVSALFSDTEAMLDHLLSRADVAKDKIVLYGVSLGAIVALRTAARRPEIAGALIESAASPDEVLTRTLGGLSAWVVSMLAMPGSIEPAANAARVDRAVLYLCGAWDSDLLAHLRAFRASLGPSASWVLPETGHSPHPLLVHDGEYQDTVAGFFEAVIQGRSPRIETKVMAQSGGVLELLLTPRDIERCLPLPVEVCIVDDGGNAQFVRRWLRASGETWRVPHEGCIASVTAWAYRRVDGSPESGSWQRHLGPLAVAAEARANLLLVASMVVEASQPLPTARSFLATLASYEARAPFPHLLEAELVPAYLKVGKALLRSQQEPDRLAGRVLLRRCLAAVPANPRLHYWPGQPYVAGFAHGEDVAEARRLLGEGG